MNAQELIEAIIALRPLPEDSTSKERQQRRIIFLNLIDGVIGAFKSKSNDDQDLIELGQTFRKEIKLLYATDGRWRDRQQAYDFYNATFPVLKRRTLALINGVINSDTPELDHFNEISNNLGFMGDINYQASVCVHGEGIEKTGSVPLEDFVYTEAHAGRGDDPRPFEQANFLMRNGFSPDAFANQKTKATMIGVQEKIAQMKADGQEPGSIRWEMMANNPLLGQLVTAGVDVTIEGLKPKVPVSCHLQAFKIEF